MSEMGNVSFGNSIKDSDVQNLADSIKELSKQMQEVRLSEREELLELEKYKQEATKLEFALVTGGLIIGRIIRLGNQSIGVMTNSGQKIILYKHTIAFIQEKIKE